MISLSRSTAAMLIALTATAAAESSPRTSADMLLPGCEILIGADPRGSAELLADAGHCYGLIEGLSYASRALGFCPPADAALAQMPRVIIAPPLDVQGADERCDGDCDLDYEQNSAKGKRGPTLGRAFNNWRRNLGINYKDRPLDFHSLRHTFGKMMEDLGISEPDRARLLGHAVPGIGSSVYSAPELKRVAPLVAKVKWEALEIP